MATRTPPSSAAPWSDAKAVMEISTAPTMIPTPPPAPNNPRPPGEPSGPDRRPCAGAPPHPREAAEPAKTAVPSRLRPTHVPNEADGDAAAITPAASDGPRIQ